MSSEFEEKLKKKIGRDAGFRVPDGYFDDLGAKIGRSLPEKEQKPSLRLSRWHRLRPYVYLAAMFGGIWCMMKMVHMMSEQPAIVLDNPPEAIAQVMQDYSYGDDALDMATAVDDMQLVSDVSEEYSSIDDFIDDFDYKLEDDYADIKVASEEP